MTRPATTGRSVLLSTDAVGGVWRYTVELCRALSVRGWRAIVVVVGPPPSAVQRAEIAPFARLDWLRAPLDWLAESRDELLAATASLQRYASEADVALLHAPALVGRQRWFTPLAVMVHSCLATWFAAVRDGLIPPDYQWRVDAAAEGLRCAGAVAAPTRAFADAVRATYGLNDVVAIHNGRLPREPASAMREPAVLTAGRLWDEGKNVAVLDQAAEGMPFQVRAAGSLQGPEWWPVPLYNVSPLGPLDEAGMACAMASASVFAAPSLYEPFGLAVLEAAQAGMALVLSDIPTFRELWDGAARFVPPRDPAAWRHALTETVAAPEPWAAQARARAARYTADACAEATAAFLERTIAAHVAA